jgi:hypothetical protein
MKKLKELRDICEKPGGTHVAMLKPQVLALLDALQEAREALEGIDKMRTASGADGAHRAFYRIKDRSRQALKNIQKRLGGET